MYCMKVKTSSTDELELEPRVEPAEPPLCPASGRVDGSARTPASAWRDASRCTPASEGVVSPANSSSSPGRESPPQATKLATTAMIPSCLLMQSLSSAPSLGVCRQIRARARILTFVAIIRPAKRPAQKTSLAWRPSASCASDPIRSNTRARGDVQCREAPTVPLSTRTRSGPIVGCQRDPFGLRWRRG